MAKAYRLGQREIGKPAADRGRELEAVARARRANHDATTPLEDEALVGRARVEARLGLDRAGIDVGEAPAHPRCDALDDRGIGLCVAVGVSLRARVMRAGL